MDALFDARRATGALLSKPMLVELKSEKRRAEVQSLGEILKVPRRICIRAQATCQLIESESANFGSRLSPFHRTTLGIRRGLI